MLKNQKLFSVSRKTGIKFSFLSNFEKLSVSKKTGFEIYDFPSNFGRVKRASRLTIAYFNSLKAYNSLIYAVKISFFSS